ncbi:phage tail tape measure protein [Phenylobacterium sp.]|uniref:phage tail tape measure protein n=1 Tax=Phenylobacterium sp. TaxID=1871053 RepID=UPI0027317192|nr:phage tail tape measure protein [Phenylobacterium sp.]MDP2214781.1 phage tail tape measure protein [Phenylobacterium sp.]
MSRITSQLVLSLLDRVTGPARAAAQSIRGITQAISENNRTQLQAMAASQRDRIKSMRGDLIGATAQAAAFALALGAPIRAAMSFESAMADVRKVVDFDTPEQFEEMARGLRAMSREVPIAAEGLAAMAAAAGQGGIDRGDILEFVRSAAMIGTAFDISADAAGEALAHLRTGLALSTPEAVSLADAMNELSNRQASTAADILEVVTRVGASAKQFGLTGEQVAGLGSAMLATGQQAEVVATSIRNMGRALTRGDAATKRQSQAYRLLGLGATETAKRMQVDAVGTIEDVVARLNKLPAHMRAAVSTDLFGDEARALGPLITNQKLLADSLGIVADQANYAGSAQKEYDVRSKTSANRAQLFKNTLDNLSITVGTILIPVMQALTDILTPIADGIERFAAQHPALVKGVTLAAGGLIVFRLATLAARFAVAQTRLTLIQGGLAFLTMRARAMATAATMRGQVAGSMMAMAITTRTATGIMKLAFRGLLAATGIGLLILAAGWVVQHWSGVKTFFKGFGQGFSAAIAPVRPALEPLIQIVKTVVGWVKKLIGDKGEDWTSWGVAAGTAVGNFVNGAVKFFGDLYGWIKKALDLAWELAKWTPQGMVIRGTIAAANAITGPKPPPGAPAPPPGRPPAGRRAWGGDVLAGQDYLVGEHRPEIFRPPVSGKILPSTSGAGSSGGGGRGGGTFAPRLSFVIQGGADARAIANEVMSRLRSEYQEFSEGGFGDDAGVFA